MLKMQIFISWIKVYDSIIYIFPLTWCNAFFFPWQEVGNEVERLIRGTHQVQEEKLCLPAKPRQASQAGNQAGKKDSN